MSMLNIKHGKPTPATEELRIPDELERAVLDRPFRPSAAWTSRVGAVGGSEASAEGTTTQRITSVRMSWTTAVAASTMKTSRPTSTTS